MLLNNYSVFDDITLIFLGIISGFVYIYPINSAIFLASNGQ